jgi:hypothetical protein
MLSVAGGLSNRQHKWLCAGGPATRQHKGPFLLAQSCWRVQRPPAKTSLAARTNHFWPSGVRLATRMNFSRKIEGRSYQMTLAISSRRRWLRHNDEETEYVVHAGEGGPRPEGDLRRRKALRACGRRGGGASNRDGKPSARAHICACSQENCQLAIDGKLVY